MASSIPLASAASFPLPSGYKFYPTDEDIVVRYLRPRAVDQPLPTGFISDKDILNHNPWDLVPESASEKYFFYCRVLKGVTGTRWNRAAKDGFWKASGKEVPVFCSGVGSRFPVMVGLKRTLVFYLGKQPGQCSNWVMQEYRLAGAGLSPYHVVRPCTNNDIGQSSSNGDVVAQKHDGPAHTLNGTAPSIENTPVLVNPDKSWVVCRIYKKMRTAPVVVRSSSSSGPEKIRFFDFLGQGNNDQGTGSTSRVAGPPYGGRQWRGTLENASTGGAN